MELTLPSATHDKSMMMECPAMIEKGRWLVGEGPLCVGGRVVWEGMFSSFDYFTE